MYTITKITVQTPNGIAVFVTSRQDDRSEAVLAREVPDYFGEGHFFVQKQNVFMNIPDQQQAERVRSLVLAACESAGETVLNVANKPAQIVG
jgi:hypothetical protein